MAAMNKTPDSKFFKELTGGWDYSSLPENIQIGEGCWLVRKGGFDRFRSERNPGLVIGDRVKAKALPLTWSRESFWRSAHTTYLSSKFYPRETYYRAPRRMPGNIGSTK